MGCSASRPVNFVTQQQHDTPNSSSSFSNSQLQSPYYSFSDSSSTPVSRTLSLPNPLVHHPPLRKGDSSHFVSLISTTYGSLVLIDPANPSFDAEDSTNPTAQNDSSSPESVINTWELMEGLDDNDNEGFPFQMEDVAKNPGNEVIDKCEIVEQQVSKPLWKYLSEESLQAKMDLNVVSSYRKALLGRQLRGGDKLKDLLLEPQNIESPESIRAESCYLFGAEDRIVVYYTSLRGIRKTYEDCCAVSVILRGFRVSVEERDISMDRLYRTELQDALKGKTVSLPEVFIKGKYIGGAEEIKRLNESGELAKLLEGLPVVDSGCVCEICGDARYVICPSCNGSRKVYDKDERESRKCPDCNENGLIRCSDCCP